MFRIFQSLSAMAEQVIPKKLKTSGPLIGTHNGQFHADEALAVYLLRMLPTYSSSPLVRTRDSTLLETCHTVVDVGGVYDPATNRYDHHQRTFETSFPEHATRMSSAGLVYLHFGKEIIAQHMKVAVENDDVSLLHNKIYDSFIEAIDANDNGIQAYDSEQLAAAGIEKRFNDTNITVPSIVRDMNQPNPDAPASLAQDEDSLFERASNFMGETFERKLRFFVSSWLPARTTMKEAYGARFDVHSSGRIMTLPQGGVPWKEHLYNLEKEYLEEHSDKKESNETEDKSAEKAPYDPKKASDAEVFYVLYPENKEPGARWRVQAASTPASAFESRLPLKESWRGVRDQDLDSLMASEAEAEGSEKIPEGAVFVHASGFIGGHATKEGAMAMAIRSLKELEKKE
ncbi:hypothetical protein KEM55_007415 [Ascosphaera atra]|nr:hypothetical protein KEM55_007415 [Ascosphaera atra]